VVDSGVAISNSENRVQVAPAEIEIDEDYRFSRLRKRDPEICREQRLADVAFSARDHDDVTQRTLTYTRFPSPLPTRKR
jgi:hypothetical protein